MYKLSGSDTEFAVRLFDGASFSPDPDDVRVYGGDSSAVVGGDIVWAVQVSTGFRLFNKDGLSLALVSDISEVGQPCRP